MAVESENSINYYQLFTQYKKRGAPAADIVYKQKHHREGSHKLASLIIPILSLLNNWTYKYEITQAKEKSANNLIFLLNIIIPLTYFLVATNDV